MRKILFLGGLKPGGAQHQMVIIASLLKKEGYDVTYLSMDNSDFFSKQLESVDIPIVRFKSSRLASLLKINLPVIAIRLNKLLKHNKYDTVISFLGEWNFMNCFLAKYGNSNHRAITGIRNNRDDVFLRKREKFFTKYEKYAFCKVSNSWSALHKFSSYYPHLASKLKVIYNVVELPPIASVYECRKDNKVHIIVPASYRELKNPIRLLEAVSLLAYHDKENLCIDWYGNIKDDIELYHKMCEFIKSKELDRVVHLYDATPQIADLINQADIVALFSTSEGLPNSICEGMMMGKPVIMSEVSDYDVLVDHSNGFLCDPFDVDSIRNSLSLASRLNDSAIKSMGANSKLKAQLLFSEETIIQKWKSIV